ncbi:hypothetical protein HAX54_013772 [Datura stramonium]|uniref:Uncharacterized protein n=1 Tax=Datura stramonium TaxID=4076 RepID=A0ABS8TLU7_DATST|nr:hypothetical protein [Datura stramonium]
MELPRESEVYPVVDRLSSHVATNSNSNWPRNRKVGLELRHTVSKWTGSRNKDGPADLASKAFYKKGPLQKNNKGQSRDDEGGRDEVQTETPGTQTQEHEYPSIPKQIGNSSEASEPEDSSTSHNGHLALPWHGEDVPKQQELSFLAAVSPLSFGLGFVNQSSLFDLGASTTTKARNEKESCCETYGRLLMWNWKAS